MKRQPGPHQRRVEAQYRLPLQKLLLRDLTEASPVGLARRYGVPRNTLNYWILKEGIFIILVWGTREDIAKIDEFVRSLQTS